MINLLIYYLLFVHLIFIFPAVILKVTQIKIFGKINYFSLTYSLSHYDDLSKNSVNRILYNYLIFSAFKVDFNLSNFPEIEFHIFHVPDWVVNTFGISQVDGQGFDSRMRLKN